MFRGSELKQKVYALTTNFSSVSTAGQQYDIGSTIGQGLEIDQRIGRAIRAVKVSLTGTMVGGQTNSVTDDRRNTVRLCLLLAESVSTFTYTVSDVLDPRLRPGLVRVLYDRVFELVTPGGDSTGYIPATKEMHLSIPINKIMTFGQAAAGAAAASPYSLFLYVVSDSAGVPHPGFVDGNMVLSYTDA